MSLPPSFDSPAPDLQEPTLVNVNLRDWLDYYKWRGLCSRDDENLTNPLALLLHWPLTLYHIAAHKLPCINPFCIPKILINRKLIIHVIELKRNSLSYRFSKNSTTCSNHNYEYTSTLLVDISTLQ
ncbi:unnamed protein product [Heterobilharzia americana]|nr:unnamed protein product [Heterobilharzia americana]